MPIHEFKCDACGVWQEINIPFKEDQVSDCYKCNKPMRRLISAPAIHFKGSGFYKTDYKDRSSDVL
jgi:putative FmdB family regulatory protein